VSETARRTAPKSDPNAVAERGSFTQIVKFLGGHHVFKKSITSKLDVHEVILKGLPGGVLMYMVKHIQTMKPSDVGHAVGVSIRTMQRRTGRPQKPLRQDQSGRAWKFAEILTTASDVFGSQSEAEKWLTTPAVALDQRRPVDLLSSPAGVEMVEQLLGRLEYGVYT
jgi:putative toxin-antitoxin system antitoxin component (TIGR02293 family)